MKCTEIGVRLATNSRLAEDLKNLILGTYPMRGGHNGVDGFIKGLPKTMDPKRVVFTTETPFGYPELELKTIELTKVDKTILNLIMGENIKRILKL